MPVSPGCHTTEFSYAGRRASASPGVGYLKTLGAQDFATRVIVAQEGYPGVLAVFRHVRTKVDTRTYDFRGVTIPRGYLSVDIQ